MAACFAQSVFRRQWQCAITALFCLLLGGCSAQQQAGVFYQPLNQDANLSVEHWQQTQVQLGEMAIGQWFIQWTAHEGSTFQANDDWLLRLVKQLQPSFNIFLGLYAESEYYQQVNSSADMPYLARYFARNRAWAATLQQRLNALDIEVEGYYFPGEVNDQLLADEQFFATWLSELLALKQQLGLPLAISSYYTGVEPLALYRERLSRLTQAGLLVLHQDGAGSQLLSANQVAQVNESLTPDVRIINELFIQQGDDFVALPANVKRHRLTEIRQQGRQQQPIYFSLRYLVEWPSLAAEQP